MVRHDHLDPGRNRGPRRGVGRDGGRGLAAGLPGDAARPAATAAGQLPDVGLPPPGRPLGHGPRPEHTRQGARLTMLYHYVGPADILARVACRPAGTQISSAADLLAWARDAGQRPGPNGLIAATFVIDSQGDLLVA